MRDIKVGDNVKYKQCTPASDCATCRKLCGDSGVVVAINYSETHRHSHFHIKSNKGPMAIVDEQFIEIGIAITRIERMRHV